MVGGTAVLPVVLVVRNKMGVYPRPAEHLDGGIVIGLDGAPAAVEEIVSAGVKLPPGRHTGHAAHISVVKHAGLLRQPGKVRRMDPIAAVAGKIMAIEGVEHDHDRSHGYASCE